MKVVILAGGFGTRLSEYTQTIPKPMVKIGGKPIITHIMSHYISYGFNDFILATGYKNNYFKKYFKGYKKNAKPFETTLNGKKCLVTILNTGLNTLTGGRLKKVKNLINDNDNFLFTYGDGVSSVNLKKLVNFHKKNKKIATLTAVRPPARFGALKIKGPKVTYFKEKSKIDEGWINGGFFVLEPRFFKYLKSFNTYLEREPLEAVTKKNQLVAYKHKGFWQCMDTKRDKDRLEKILKSKKI